MSDTAQLPERTGAGRPHLPFEVRIPQDFTEALLEHVANGKTLNEAVIALGRRYSRPAVLAWAKESPEFGDKLQRAQAYGRQAWADDQLVIADDTSSDTDERGAGNVAAVKRAELRIRTRQWLLERLEPETYSPRHQVDHRHTHTHTLDPDSTALLEELRTELRASQAPLIEGKAQDVVEHAADDGDTDAK